MMSVDQGAGLEGWRRLARRYSGAGLARLHGGLTGLLNPERGSLMELSSCILRWEAQVRAYELHNEELLGERVKASVLCIMTGGHKPLKEHLDLNSGRLRGYAQMRDEIIAYLEGKVGIAVAARAGSSRSGSSGPATPRASDRWRGPSVGR